MFSSCTLQWPPRLVTVPGLSGSDGAHWQTWLERQFAQSLRVEQRDWNAPELHDWSASIDRLLARERGPFVLAAHSFGCLAAAQAIARAPHRLVGALLVAPAAPAHFGVAKALHRSSTSVMLGTSTSHRVSGRGRARNIGSIPSFTAPRRYGSLKTRPSPPPDTILTAHIRLRRPKSLGTGDKADRAR
jgi:pimeloyl-ACP methyl ester carboxylesterase